MVVAAMVALAIRLGMLSGTVSYTHLQIFVVVKEALVGLNGLFGQVDTVGAKLKSGTRLVKANVAIVANEMCIRDSPEHRHTGRTGIWAKAGLGQLCPAAVCHRCV